MEGVSFSINDLISTLAARILSHKDIKRHGLGLILVIVEICFHGKLLLTFIIEIELFVHVSLHLKK